MSLSYSSFAPEEEEEYGNTLGAFQRDQNNAAPGGEPPGVAVEQMTMAQASAASEAERQAIYRAHASAIMANQDQMNSQAQLVGQQYMQSRTAANGAAAGHELAGNRHAAAQQPQAQASQAPAAQAQPYQGIEEFHDGAGAAVDWWVSPDMLKMLALALILLLALSVNGTVCHYIKAQLESPIGLPPSALTDTTVRLAYPTVVLLLLWWMQSAFSTTA